MGSVDSISRYSISEVNNRTSPNSMEKKQYNLDQQPDSTLQKEKNKKDINEKELDQVVTDMNQVLGNTHTSLKYVYHEKLEKYYVSLVNDDTKEVVREIPPKKLLDIYASMRDYLGLFVDNKI
ncbi:flagellar protein FlaG [Fredinandcohnia sp. QZ13]|uniref:flagellar protein FlaG n=1 Tax=Fredinandcohnia sp. QZ13 TaxID=3073144 RepID=UPI0028536D79|nr:flagellar protein FlaG [Fredinandcohnia sp. QZ13]MDR4889980.1 flagellar protein FlaG [Fredinandcohnia sp. QZ13]